MHKNTTKQAWLLALALIATSSGTLAQASEQFVGAQGFRTMPIEQLEGKRYYARRCRRRPHARLLKYMSLTPRACARCAW